MDNSSTPAKPSVQEIKPEQPIHRSIEHFQPGENLFIKPEWRRKAEPQYKQVKVSAPGRLVFTVFNLALVSGGMGISTDTIKTELSIIINDNIKNNSDPVWNHLLILFNKITGYKKNNISLTITKEIKHRHAGLGSNIVYSTAIIAGLNALFGCPFSINEIWEIIIHNYMEYQENDESLVKGYSSGVGAASLLYGGLVWIDEGSEPGQKRYLGKVETDDLWALTAIGNMENLKGNNMKSNSQYSEYVNIDTDEERIKFRLEFQKNNEHILKPYFNSLKTNLIMNDLKGFLKNSWKINEIGAKKYSIQVLYKTDIFRDVWALSKENGALYAGSSSIGPGIFVLSSTEKNARELQNMLKGNFGEYFNMFNVGRAGKRIDINIE